MARTRASDGGIRLTVEKNEPEGETIDVKPETPAQTDAEALNQAESDDVLIALTKLDAAGDVTRWQIKRISPSESAGYVCDLSTDELTLANVKKKCGPGKYLCTGFTSQGRYVARRTFDIAADKDSPGTMIVGGGLPFDLAALLSEMRGDKGKWKEDLKFWGPILIPFLTPIAAKLAERMFTAKRETSLADLAGVIVTLNKMSAPQSQATTMERIKEFKQFQELFGGGNESSTGSTGWDIARDAVRAVPALLGAITTARRGGAAGGAQPQSVDMGAGQSETQQPTQPQGETPMIRLINWFSSYVPLLLQSAAKGSDPTLYADLLADNVPDEITPEQLQQLLSRPDWYELLSNFSPDVRRFEAWFRDMHTELLKQLNEEVEENKKTPGA
jgi:hypothetical protein